MIMPEPKYGEYYTLYNNRVEDNMLEARTFYNVKEQKVENMF